MTAEQFAYWLQGYSEVCGKRPNKDEWQIIQDHLKLVFDKQTPLRDMEPRLPDQPSTHFPHSPWPAWSCPIPPTGKN